MVENPAAALNQVQMAICRRIKRPRIDSSDFFQSASSYKGSCRRAKGYFDSIRLAWAVATRYLNQCQPRLTWMPLNSGFRLPRLAFEICHQRQASSRAWFCRVEIRTPPPPRAMKLNVELSPAGKLALVCTAPPPSSTNGETCPRCWVEFQRRMIGSKAVPEIR